MKLKAVSGMMLTLLLIGMLALAFNIQPVNASGTIYITADGSIDPPSAPVSTSDKITYTLIGEISDSIVVQRDNIVVNGAKYTVKGADDGRGIDLSGRYNVTIENMTIKSFRFGIWCQNSNSNYIIGNNIMDNIQDGIHVFALSTSLSHHNHISRNNISGNNCGIWLRSLSKYSSVIGNNIRNNGHTGIRVNGLEHIGQSSGNNISLNNIENHGQYGIWLCTSSYNSISFNNITDSGNSIFFEGSSNNTIAGNNLRNNDWTIMLTLRFGPPHHPSSNNNIVQNKIEANTNGIIARDSPDTTISGNTIASNNYMGIWLDNCSNTNISLNNITNNNDIGIRIEYSSSNIIYHNNFVNNAQQVANPTPSYANTWDDGYPSGGNYWSDHVCVGNPSDGSQPYIINEDNTDHYPFQNSNGWVILGDINGDGIVDIFDVVLAASAFDSKPGDSNWNQAADLNNDDVVDIFDIVLLAQNFGKTT